MGFSSLQLTADFILEEVATEEEIFERYLYPVSFSSKYVNPFREDTHPDCKFYVGKTGILWFVDKAWNNKHYNCFGACMAYYKCTLSQALSHIYDDFEGNTIGVRETVATQRKKRINSPTNVSVAVKPFTERELAFWNVGGIIVTEKLLNERGIYSVQTLWENTWVKDNLKMVFAYIEEGKISQIYYPLRKKGERRFINTTGFIIGNLNLILNGTDFIVITKSKKDTFFLEQFGISAIYTANETITIDKELYEKLSKKYTYIFTLMDRDRQGKHSAWMHRKVYGIPPLFVPEGKDFTECLSIMGYRDVGEMIEDFKSRL